MKTEPPLVITYMAVNEVYEWECRRCGTTDWVHRLSEAEADGFAHVRECRG